MAAVNIGDKFVKKISMIGNTVSAKVPVVVVGIADGELRFQSRFLC
jgi:hypothetical protein